MMMMIIMRMMIMIIMKEEEEDGENAYDDDGVLNWGNAHHGTSDQFCDADDNTSEINNGADA